MLSITATELPRFMQCNGSIDMKTPKHDVQIDTTVKDEGAAAHWLAEQVFKGDFDAEELVDRQAPNGVYITGEMVEYLEPYLTADRLATEVETSYSNQQFNVRGRCDSFFYENDTLYINELKYGWSIVEPDMNWTLISHAIGLLHNYPQVKTVIFTIYQPRPHHPEGRVRSWTITGEELITLQSQLIKALTQPDGQLNTGKECRNCPALAYCPAARKTMMNTIEATEKAFVDTLDNEQLSFMLDDLKRAGAMLQNLQKAYEELAQHRLKQGNIVRNYTLENELTNRKWKKGITPEIIESLTGKQVSKKQIVTPNQAEKAGVSPKVVASFTERVNKGVKLVRSDANAKASKYFNQPTKG